MIYQNDKRLNDNINKYGCFFMDLLHISQVEVKKVLTIKDINYLYSTFVRKGYIKENCYILDYCGIINSTLNYFSCHKKYELTKDKSKAVWMIKKIYTNREKTLTHFVLADIYGDIFYDSLLGKGYTNYGSKEHRFFK